MIVFVFFFQAEDGIRDIGVTGVQTCALPIFLLRSRLTVPQVSVGGDGGCVSTCWLSGCPPCPYKQEAVFPKVSHTVLADRKERRVGKECRSRWSPYH